MTEPLANLKAPQLTHRNDQPYEGAFADPNRFNERVKVLWFGVGSKEPELFSKAIHGAANALKSSGVHVVYVESPGTAHEWQTWRRALDDFAPRLFHQAGGL